MKKRKVLSMSLVGFASALILSLGMAVTCFAADEHVTTMATTAPLNLRDATGLYGKVLAVMPKNTSVRVFSMTKDGWYNVEYEGQKGYAYYKYLNFEGTEDGAVHDGKVTDMYATTGLNVRSKPTTDSSIIGSLSKGQAVEVFHKQDNWFEVKYDGKTGYCYGLYLAFGQDEEDVSGSTMNELTTTAPLNVRTEPSMNGKIIGSFKAGEKVQVLAEEGDWLKVKFGDKVGYSHSNYIK